MANFNLNKVILGGRLTSDVELKQTTSGISVCSFTMAVARKGNRQDTDFINCQAWRATAEFVSKYFHKGSSICIVGNIQTRSWEDQNGYKRYATDVVADEVMFVDSKGEMSEAASPSYIPESYTTPTTPNFEDANSDDSLPF